MPPYPKPIKQPKINLDSIYKILRLRKLTEQPLCEVKDCGKKAVDVDHTAGRNGVRVIIYEWFKSVCREHHKDITEHSSKWIVLGHSLPRGCIEVTTRVQWVKNNLSEYLLSLGL